GQGRAGGGQTNGVGRTIDFERDSLKPSGKQAQRFRALLHVVVGLVNVPRFAEMPAQISVVHDRANDRGEAPEHRPGRVRTGSGGGGCERGGGGGGGVGPSVWRWERRVEGWGGGGGWGEVES